MDEPEWTEVNIKKRVYSKRKRRFSIYFLIYFYNKFPQKVKHGMRSSRLKVEPIFGFIEDSRTMDLCVQRVKVYRLSLMLRDIKAKLSIGRST